MWMQTILGIYWLVGKDWWFLLIFFLNFLAFFFFLFLLFLFNVSLSWKEVCRFGNLFASTVCSFRGKGIASRWGKFLRVFWWSRARGIFFFYLVKLEMVFLQLHLNIDEIMPQKLKDISSFKRITNETAIKEAF